MPISLIIQFVCGDLPVQELMIKYLRRHLEPLPAASSGYNLILTRALVPPAGRTGPLFLRKPLITYMWLTTAATARHWHSLSEFSLTALLRTPLLVRQH